MEQVEQVPAIVGAIFAVNMLLSGFSMILDGIKNKTENKVDNKVARVVGKLAKTSQKAVDFIGMNRAHK